MLAANRLSAELYLVLGERPPAHLCVTVSDPVEQAILDEAYVAWQMNGQDSFFERDLPRLPDFIRGVDFLQSALADPDLSGENSERIMEIFYDSAKIAFGDERSSIREFFRYLYVLVFGFENGPRWAEFVKAFGLEEFREHLSRKVFEIND